MIQLLPGTPFTSALNGDTSSPFTSALNGDTSLVSKQVFLFMKCQASLPEEVNLWSRSWSLTGLGLVLLLWIRHTDIALA